MKAASGLLFFLLLTPMMAQVRMIPHVTRADGGFSTTIIVANPTAVEQFFAFTAYTSGGEVIGTPEEEYTVAAGATNRYSVEELFGVSEVSHFTIDSGQDLIFSAAYVADGAGTGPAHVTETSIQSPVWRFYGGNTAVTWDGVAVVNMGDRAADLFLRRLDAAGNLIDSRPISRQLPPRAKALDAFTDLNPAADATYEVWSDQPLAMTALRGSLDRSFLWENKAFTSQHIPLNDLSIVATRAFPELVFDSPLDLQAPGDDSNRLFLVEKGGRIYAFPNQTSTRESVLFLDISSRVATRSEMGLLGLAFHPNYAENRRFFINYSLLPGGETIVAEMLTDPDNPNLADPDSERILMEVDQPFPNHNGGQMAFGPDGYLYISMGDGGSGGDPLNHGQNRSTLLGSILRIDVDNVQGNLPYAIPADNPFAGSSAFREEIYAYGLRNPWRFSFDVSDGVTRLWAGDVGQDRIEEIVLVENGGNYGWKTMEGTLCFSPSNSCDSTDLIPPVFEYNHDNNDKSITGGFVYRGAALPQLYGAYIYGDFVSGRVWALFLDGETPQANVELFDFTNNNITSFGLDESGEIYFTAFNGSIYSLSSQ